MELEAARLEGFVSNHLSENKGTHKKKLLAVIGIITKFGRKNNRDAIRRAWMPTGRVLSLFVSFALYSLYDLRQRTWHLMKSIIFLFPGVALWFIRDKIRDQALEWCLDILIWNFQHDLIRRTILLIDFLIPPISDSCWNRTTKKTKGTSCWKERIVTHLYREMAWWKCGKRMTDERKNRWSDR